MEQPDIDHVPGGPKISGGVSGSGSQMSPI
ncbi:MAG: hypothetical protein QOH78_873 [Verrucomicrobiota bacterium]|jgi:hypothetical protein